jgi:hypothetical protein
MLSNMEKFINFKQLNVVKTGTSTADGSAALTLTDSAALFTQLVLPHAIVWDRATARKYLVTEVTSDTVLALEPIGVDTGTGVPNATAYFIYMPEYTVVTGSTTDASQAADTFQIVDTTVDFLSLGVKVGDTARDITNDVDTQVLSITTTTNPHDTLNVSASIGATPVGYIIYRDGADDHDTIVRSADVADVSNASADTSINNITYGPAGTAVMKIDYAYSSTVGANSDMRNAVQDAVTASLQTAWPSVAYDFPGLLNPAVAVTNATWLGGQNYFFLKIQKV